MNEPHPTFDYNLQPDETAPDSEREATTATLTALASFFDRHILRNRLGVLLPPRSVAARVLVLESILQPAGGSSLRGLAAELGMTAAGLSKIALYLHDELGLSASWQRVNLRDEYSERAAGVHAGSWEVTPKWARDRARLKRRKRSQASTTATTTKSTDSNPKA